MQSRDVTSLFLLYDALFTVTGIRIENEARKASFGGLKYNERYNFMTTSDIIFLLIQSFWNEK